MRSLSLFVRPLYLRAFNLHRLFGDDALGSSSCQVLPLPHIQNKTQKNSFTALLHNNKKINVPAVNKKSSSRLLCYVFSCIWLFAFLVHRLLRTTARLDSLWVDLHDGKFTTHLCAEGQCGRLTLSSSLCLLAPSHVLAFRSSLLHAVKSK